MVAPQQKSPLAQVLKVKEPQVSPNVVVSESTVTAEQAEIAELKAMLAAKEAELAATKTKLPVNDYITLRGNSPTFSVVIDRKRCLFVNFLFTTRDRALANAILAEYPTIITEVKDDTQYIQ